MSSKYIGIEDARKNLGPLVTAVQQGTDVVLTRNGKPAARLIRAQEDFMETANIPPLSDGTRAAIANVVDYTIEREYSRDVAAELAGAKQVAAAGLQFDLLASGATQDMVRSGLVDTTLRILVRDGLASRVCRCAQIHPHGCPHGSASGSLWCSKHYEADVPELRGALLCGTCHVVEFEQ